MGAVRAAGALVLAPDAHPAALLVAGAGVHTVVSFGWASVLAVALPRRRTAVAGAAVGLAIAGLDLGVVGRRIPAIRALPTVPQVADHLAFGTLVGVVLARRRRRSRG
jgi:deoxyinosine 3'endonuclease (endonuclease V)